MFIKAILILGLKNNSFFKFSLCHCVFPIVIAFFFSFNYTNMMRLESSIITTGEWKTLTVLKKKNNPPALVPSVNLKQPPCTEATGSIMPIQIYSLLPKAGRIQGPDPGL